MSTKKIIANKSTLPMRMAILHENQIQGKLLDFESFCLDISQIVTLRREELNALLQKIGKDLSDYIENRGLKFEEVGESFIFSLLEKELQDMISSYFFLNKTTKKNKKAKK